MTRDHDPDTPPGVSEAACFILVFRDNLFSSSRGMLASASTTHDLAWRRQPGAAALVLNKPQGPSTGCAGANDPPIAEGVRSQCVGAAIGSMPSRSDRLTRTITTAMITARSEIPADTRYPRPNP